MGLLERFLDALEGERIAAQYSGGLVGLCSGAVHKYHIGPGGEECEGCGPGRTARTDHNRLFPLRFELAFLKRSDNARYVRIVADKSPISFNHRVDRPHPLGIELPPRQETE